MWTEETLKSSEDKNTLSDDLTKSPEEGMCSLDHRSERSKNVE